jgi:hypothetical protein
VEAGSAIASPAAVVANPNMGADAGADADIAAHSAEARTVDAIWMGMGAPRA